MFHLEYKCANATMKQNDHKAVHTPLSHGNKRERAKKPAHALLLLLIMLPLIGFAPLSPLQAQAKPEPSSFYQRLVSAALARTQHVVIYNPKYFSIPYPGGDVPAHYGVCTDVVIRAYREVGVDLQKEVHKKMGGDRNIAHRRVRVLRKFLKSVGASLPVSQNPADYKPGDMVTYYIPEAIFSKDHIAIVSDKKGISGNYMIVHNIGLGPKLDDDLMTYKITGHYRYRK